jgi:hypothetical protein
LVLWTGAALLRKVMVGRKTTMIDLEGVLETARVWHKDYGELIISSYSESKKTIYGFHPETGKERVFSPENIVPFTVHEAQEELQRQKRENGWRNKKDSRLFQQWQDENPVKFNRLCEIWRADKKFNMPISVPPSRKAAVMDDISSAEGGITVASERKLFTSYDVVFSPNAEVDLILEGSGAKAGPYYDSKVLRVLNGPRIAVYTALLDAGFKPTHLEG